VRGSTLTQNEAHGGSGGPGGGGPTTGAPGPSGSAVGGGFFSSAANEVFNSLIAGNLSTVAPDCAGSFTSHGYNLLGVLDGAIGFANTGDQAGTFGNPLNPHLGPLGFSRGTTPTHPLLDGSPAIDRGHSLLFGLPTALVIDQSGRPRPIDLPNFANASGGDGTDIGAVELDPLEIPIPGLFNTGVNGSGQVQADDATELHYTLVLPSPVIGAPTVATSASGFPIPPWLGDTTASAWIAPSASTDGAPGQYRYRLTFNLTGTDHTRAEISGRWASDNGGQNILLNDVSTGWTSGGFSSFSIFRITSGFVPGINTLTFAVNNDGTLPNPAGLRVEIRGTTRADLQITSITYSGSNAKVTWISQPGRIYRLQRKTDLLQTDWVDVAGDVTATSGISIKVHGVGFNAAKHFYRVLLLP
jgi:hypothetical protein